MQTIERRIAALEQANPANKFVKTIIITFPTPGEPKRELYGLRSSPGKDECQEWTREPHETEQEFTDHANKEAKRSNCGVALLFKWDLNDEEPCHAIN
jgi:hypothetical protein